MINLKKKILAGCGGSCIIPALKRQRWRDYYEFEDNLGYRETLSQTNKQMARRILCCLAEGMQKPPWQTYPEQDKNRVKKLNVPTPACCCPNQDGRLEQASLLKPTGARWKDTKEGKGITPKCPASQPLSKLLGLPRLTLVSGLYSLAPSGRQMNAKESEPGQSWTVMTQVRDLVPTGYSMAENKSIPTPTAIWRFQRAGGGGEWEQQQKTHPWSQHC